MPQGHAKRAQRAKGAAPLFKGKPDGRLDDEKTNRKRQKSKGREVEVKARGQLRNIRAVLWAHQIKLGHIAQRRQATRLVGQHKEVRQPRLVQEALRDGHVGQNRATRHIRNRDDRADIQALSGGKVFGRGQQNARAADECSKIQVALGQPA